MDVHWNSCVFFVHGAWSSMGLRECDRSGRQLEFLNMLCTALAIGHAGSASLSWMPDFGAFSVRARAGHTVWAPPANGNATHEHSVTI